MVIKEFMRKSVYGYKLGRNTKQRMALFKSLMNSLILLEKIETTLPKAKAIKGPLERLITLSKEGNIQNRRRLVAKLGLENSAAKLIEVIGPKFKNRPGGYLRIVRLGPRAGDKASLARLEFVEDLKPEIKKEVKIVETKEKPKVKVTRKKKPEGTKNA